APRFFEAYFGEILLEGLPGFAAETLRELGARKEKLPRHVIDAQRLVKIAFDIFLRGRNRVANAVALILLQFGRFLEIELKDASLADCPAHRDEQRLEQAIADFPVRLALLCRFAQKTFKERVKRGIAQIATF